MFDFEGDIFKCFVVEESNMTSCYCDMGMSDLRIQDFQLEATTSLTGHEPYKARPHYNGWCTVSNDLQPYLQVSTTYLI